MLFGEAKKISEEIKELCKDMKHPSRIMAREVMRALNAEMDKMRKRSGSFQKSRSAPKLDQAQMYNREKLKCFKIDSKYEKQLLKALERAKEQAGVTEIYTKTS